MTGARSAGDDCFAYDGRRMPVQEALDELASRLAPVTGTETVSLRAAVGRLLAEPVISRHDVPAADNSAVDGYAVRAADLAADGPTELTLGPSSAAGAAPLANLPAATAVRILTGAAMPEGYDTVVMQEEAERDETAGTVTLPAGIKAGANRRRAGEAVQASQVAVPAGQRLRSQDIALAAAVGAGQVTVYKPLRVALFSTGDELYEPGTAIKPGQAIDSNRPMLASLLAALPVEVTDLGILPDHGVTVAGSLRAAADQHDVILTSGGASTGDTDHLVNSLRHLGTLHSWQVAIKPGRPIALGEIGTTTLIALPGNPVAAFVCFLMFAHPALLRLAGGAWWTPPRLPVPAAFSLSKKPGRTEWLRARLVTDSVAGDGTGVEIFRQTGSGRLQSLTWADGLVELAESVTDVQPGLPVRFIPFSAFGLASRLVDGLPYWP